MTAVSRIVTTRTSVRIASLDGPAAVHAATLRTGTRSATVASAVSAPVARTPHQATGGHDGTPAAQLSSVELVERAQAGDAPAFRELHDRYAPRLRRFLAGRVTESHVDDIVNETFLRAWRNLDSFRWQGRDIAAWLYTIARNLVADHYGRRRTTHELPADDPGIYADSDSSTTRGAEDTVIDLIEAERVRDAVRALPPLQRQCVQLRFLEELSVAETARLMGRQDAAVRALQARALRSLAASPAVPALS